MPELPEVERYRQLAVQTVGRTITQVEAPDAWIVKGHVPASRLDATLRGLVVAAVRRTGKLLLLDLSLPKTNAISTTLGMHFGMTGTLILDGLASEQQMRYTSTRDNVAWHRFTLRFGDGLLLTLRDPRRLGRIEVDPLETKLGPDALTITKAQFNVAFKSTTAIKARLLDQHVVAGVGNLIADEMLWRARLSPQRVAKSLDTKELAALYKHMRLTISLLQRRGGSHTGDLMDHRRAGGHCPRCGALLITAKIGSRTSWWCPKCQQ